MAIVPVARAEHLLAFVGLLREIGAPVDRELARARLPIFIEEMPEAWVSLELAFRFLMRCAAREGIEDLGFEAGWPVRLEDLSLELLDALDAAPTIKARLECFIRFARLEANTLRCTLIPEGKTNQEINYTLSGRASYRTKRNKTDLGYNTVLSSRNNASRAFRSVLDASFTHFFKRRWYGMAIAQLETNDQLGLEQRSNVGGGAGRFIFQTNRSMLSIGGGVTTNREKYVTDPIVRTSLEGLLNISYDFFVHGDLGTDITSSFTVFPSFTDSGRYRAELNFKYRQEIIRDLYIALSGWYSFDSDAPVGLVETTRQDDYGLVTSLGWEF